jgi:hypothetical protein
VRTIELSGKIDKVDGSCPAVSFEVQDRTVDTSSSTRYEDGNCRDIKKKKRVHVRGTLMSDGRVRADRVQFGGEGDDEGIGVDR